MTNEQLPAAQPGAPASEASIQELIALERARAERDHSSRNARQGAIVWGITAILLLGVGGAALYSKVSENRERDRDACELGKVLNGYSLVEAELVCK